MTNRQMRKVPHVTAIFWVVKIFTTAIGESITDYLVKIIDPVIAVIFGAIGLLAALFIQFKIRRYVPWIYWLTVVMVAIFGTMAADVLHIVIGVPYAVSTIFFSVSLMIIFVVWYMSERTLSIHSIDTFRREVFYWLTVLTTFALGTAVGDFTAFSLHLGFAFSGFLFAILITIPAVAFKVLKLNEVIAFWLAYILTRPLGASLADWGGKPHSLSGLGFGDGAVTLALTILIVTLVGYLQATHIDVETDSRAH